MDRCVLSFHLPYCCGMQGSSAAFMKIKESTGPLPSVSPLLVYQQFTGIVLKNVGHVNTTKDLLYKKIEFLKKK